MSEAVCRFNLPPSLQTFVNAKPARQLEALCFILTALQNNYLDKLSRKEHAAYSRAMEPAIRTAHEMMDSPLFIKEKPGNYSGVYAIDKAMQYFYGHRKVPKAARKGHSLKKK
jgi:hypothetical protein